MNIPLWFRLKQNITQSLNWLSFLLGLNLVFAYAPFSHWWLPYLVFPLWFYLIRDLGVREATKQGFIFAFGWFASGLSWVHVSIDQFGGVPLIVSILLMILLISYLAVYPALACYLSAKCNFTSAPSYKLSLTLVPLFWVITDIFRGTFLTGFPWLSIGYSQIDGPLSILAPIIGEQGLCFIVLLLSVALTNLIVSLKRKKQVCKASLVIISLVCVSSYIASTLQWVKEKPKPVSVALVQGNIAQDLKWNPEQEWPNAMTYLGLTNQNFDADIVIWPESAVTGLEPMQWVQDFLSLADEAAAMNQSAIVTGILNYDIKTREYFNGLTVLGNHQRKPINNVQLENEPVGVGKLEIIQPSKPQGDYKYSTTNRYYKNHLLPIGEFVPFQEWLAPLAPLFNLPMSSFSRGDYVQANITANGYHLLPLICFEIAFPEQLAANLTKQTDAILTVSNDAWFGRSHGPHQHLDIARMRALEFGRPVIRATNTGITAIIDYQGNVTKSIPQFEQQVLRGNVTLTSGMTPYGQWHPYIIWLIVLLYTPILLWRFIIKRFGDAILPAI